MNCGGRVFLPFRRQFEAAPRLNKEAKQGLTEIVRKG